jgi:hypothetical protein
MPGFIKTALAKELAKRLLASGLSRSTRKWRKINDT